MPPPLTLEEKIQRYVPFRLTTDISKLEDWEREMIPLLVSAAKVMDELFLEQAFPGRRRLRIEDLAAAERRYLEINYGPWDRLDENRPFIEGVGAKPLGASFYPEDMTKEEFEQAALAAPARAAELRSHYTVVLRDGLGQLLPRAYRVHYRDRLEKAARYLEEAAAISKDPSLARYLELRAKSLLNDDYRTSDLAWMDMKSNRLDIVIGPIETYEDKLFGIKAAFEAYVLVKDLEWSERLERYAPMLPELQRGLPVSDEYKKETPGSDSDLYAYDAIYYAGDCNAGSKTIAINLPNDEVVQEEKGSRRLQLKNAIRAKFDKILLPI
ncbi:MAG TPA: Zn-dependent hydrolase, partial [Planctomycetota bacterium]|nr:Zn-dependent hydrolase [Planctomycetota bacterium]